MSIVQYETQVSPEGLITLPPIPEYYNCKVTVSVDEKPPIKKKRKATPEEAQAFMDTCYGCLAELSDEEFERMKMERILGN